MQVNNTLTITSGTPLCVGTGDGVGAFERQMANSIFIQVKSNATSGKVTVMAGIRGGTTTPRVPSTANAADVSAELSAAPDANTPGGSYSDVKEDHGVDVNRVWVDAATTGTKVIVSYDLRV